MSQKTDYKCPACKCGDLMYDEYYQKYLCDTCNFIMEKDVFLRNYIKSKKEREKIQKEGEEMATNSKKGNCECCYREGVAIAGHEVCSACYPIGKRFNWNLEKMREYRAEHPVREKGKKGGAGQNQTGKVRGKYKKKISVGAKVFPIKDAILNGQDKTISVSFDIKLSIENVKLCQ